MGYLSIPNEIRPIKATEAVLARLEDAAKLGLKGDNLALAAGLLPAEYKRLIANDPHVEVIVAKGRAESEIEMATLLTEAARGGDVKAQLAILQNQHGWSDKGSQQTFGSNGITIVIGGVNAPDHSTAINHGVTVEHE